MQLVIDKEVAPDDEEQDDSRQDIAVRLVQPEDCGNLRGASPQSHQQEGRKDHADG